ncbi:hypothetical protein Ancab_029132 [Ancistrocladus abbreviatus]
MDEVLASVAETIKNFAVTYVVDITEVPDFNTMYELYDPCTVMFFFRNKHIMIDLGTGNNNKINWALTIKQEFIDIVETVYRGARKGRGLEKPGKLGRKPGFETPLDWTSGILIGIAYIWCFLKFPLNTGWVFRSFDPLIGVEGYEVAMWNSV